MASVPATPIPPTYRPSVHITSLPATSSIEEIISILDRDGGLILTDFVSKDQLAQIDTELDPYVKADNNDMSGFNIIPQETKIINGLVGKSPTVASLCEHPHLAELRKQILTDAGDRIIEDLPFPYHLDPLLSVSMSFRMGSGAPRQRLHRDDTVHLIDHSVPYKLNKVSQFACLIAAVETTQENGATMFIPGSHKWDHERRPKPEEVTFAGKYLSTTTPRGVPPNLPLFPSSRFRHRPSDIDCHFALLLQPHL
jgi:ectoine hydroxylase-related dioxygenase (phytanoyl-CoA dioxygenase family)